MKKLAFLPNFRNIALKLVLPAIAATVLSFGLVPDPLPIGSAMPLPDLKMKNTVQKRISLNDVKDKNGLLVMFSCNTCPYVIKNQERTKAIAAYAKANRIGFIVINSNEGNRAKEDSPEEMKKYAAEQGYEWNYVIDEGAKLADAFGASRTPEVFLFDRSATLVYHGAIDDSPADPENIKREHLKIAIDELLADQEISVKKTRSVGCGIKRS